MDRPGGDTAERAAQPSRIEGPFRFESTTVDGGRITLRYRLGDDLDLVEVVEFPFEIPDTTATRRAIHVLHLVAGVSYYKLAAPTKLLTPPLSHPEWTLLSRLYDDGLREMAYRNGITVPLPVDIEAAEPIGDVTDEIEDSVDDTEQVGALIPVGGGKDSALVAALVPDGRLFAVNPVGAQRHLAEALGRELVGATRTLDPKLRELNESGAPNGHVPVTAITSAISVVAALSLGLRDVIMGIERSADEPTVTTADGVPVNHQFSKSTEAEGLLRAVFAPSGVRYFSLLRPLTELAIGAGVVDRGLAGDIVSCNRVFTVWNENTSSREQRPCGECAKCLFTALMLAPASDPDEIAALFGRPLLDESDHIDPVRGLWSSEKPFDCVGERLETAAAVVLLSEREAWRDQAVPAAVADEARAMLAAEGVEPASFLVPGSLDDLPAEYRDRIAALSSALTSVGGVA
ncbi:MAG: hypothetical protein KDB02_02750 [Acidimicrobiales bacterium]|nr:hypothetical protein [Acidimicrobiales bacterium]